MNNVTLITGYYRLFKTVPVKWGNGRMVWKKRLYRRTNESVVRTRK